MPSTPCFLAIAAGGLGSLVRASEVAREVGEVSAEGFVDPETGRLQETFALKKSYDLGQDPGQDFDIEEHSDQFLTHSCANYVNDGSTVFARDGNLVLKVSSDCPGGGCLNSGRIMSKDSYQYGLFMFTAKVPKCNHVWPAIWLLPGDQHGTGRYGTWPCSGEIDVLETVHNESTGTFNLVSGYGTTSWEPGAEIACNRCQPSFHVSSTMDATFLIGKNPYFVEPPPDCENNERLSWAEHTWVMDWREEQVTTWVDPVLTWGDDGSLVGVEARPSPAEADGIPTWNTFRRETTPKWSAVEPFFEQCFAGESSPSAPFDIGFKIVLNIAVGGYGPPCMWGTEECQTTCGAAVGSELIMSNISVWEKVLV